MVTERVSRQGSGAASQFLVGQNNRKLAMSLGAIIMVANNLLIPPLLSLACNFDQSTQHIYNTPVSFKQYF